MTPGKEYGKNDTGLAAGTLVTTPDGEKRIEEVKAGDSVLSGVGGWGASRFCEVKKAVGKPYCGPILKVAVEGDETQFEFQATPNHICFGNTIKYKSDKSAILLNLYGEYDDEDYIHSISRKKDSQTFDWSNNVDRAEEAARKIAKANAAEIVRFASFIYPTNFRFMPAKDLEVGMEVPAVENGKVEHSQITNITEEQYDGLVYALDIPEARNFAANGVLIHDSTSVQF